MHCPRCDFENPAGFRFCGSCGFALEPQSVAAEPERRQITVVFCDLVGSTALSIRLDPEELREVVRAYQEAVAGVIERYGGWVAQYLGDGILAYFGYPAALEFEAERAVRAALDAVIAVKRLELGLHVRVGVHTGVVVVGEVGGGGRREHLALGDVPNLAARLQGVADPDTVVISAETHRLVNARFECSEAGVPALRGIERQEPVYRVTAERSERRMVGVQRLVGRDRELDALLSLWERARTGSGQLAIVSGDPGVGKSHLVRELRARAGATPCAQLECRCLPYYQNTAYYPITELIRSEARCDPDQSVEQRIESLAGLLGRTGFPLEQAMPLFTSLMSLPPDERWTAADMLPEARKARTRDALLRLLLALAEAQPLIIVVEDIHWADPSTLEFLALVAERIGDARMLVVLTHRPGDFASLETTSATRVRLGNLRRDDTEAIVLAVTGGRTLPETVMRQIVARTDGVPLFVEELTRTILESGMLREEEGQWVIDGPLPPLAIPSTLHDSLEARLDRLSTVKEIAQLGATIGREFPYALLRAVAPVSEPMLDAALDQLIAADLLRPTGSPARRSFTFKHALIQEAAYESLLRSTRQQHHLRIARALEGDFADHAAPTPELIAHHYTAAGLVEPAVRYWKLAGRRALERSATVEAAAHLRAGLELVAQLQDRRAAARTELEMLAMLGPAVIAHRGYGALELQDIFARARLLCADVEDAALLGPVLTGIFAFHFVRTEQKESEALAAELRAAGEQTGDAMLSITARTATGLALMVRGEFAASAAELERVLADYDRDRFGPRAFAYGQDIGVIALIYLGLTNHLLGRSATGREMVLEAVRLADAVRHPHSRAAALSIAGTLHQYQRDVNAVRLWAARLAALSAEHSFDHWTVESGLLEGWVHAKEGRKSEAIQAVETARAKAGALGSELRDRYYALVGETLGLSGRAHEGIAALEEVRSRAIARSERWWWRSDADRIQGELLLVLDPDADAEPWLLSALATAREFGSPTLALRASLSLAHLRARRGDPEGARDLVRDALTGMHEPPVEADAREATLLLGADVSFVR